MGILCIKTTNETSDLVIQHQMYYSNGIPRKDFSAVLILGTAENGGIPVLAECGAITIDACTTVNSHFSKVDKDWIYEWKLQINNIFKPSINLLNYVDKSTQSYFSIKHCQGMSYVEENDFRTQLPIKGEAKYELTKAAGQLSNVDKNQNTNKTTTNNTVEPIDKILPLRKPYLVGQTVSVKVAQEFNFNKYQGKVINIEEINKTNFNGIKVLVDQKLTVELPNQLIKKYMASKI
ncbi:hypothetical protein [Clostridium algidicarnis]|uniref:hypothetical protein n=1 Tax=Clostridium algidicarnis TaxID=37659 RepID=UPI003FD72004